MSGLLRYCLHDNRLFLPADESVLTEGHRLCWGTFREEELRDHPWLRICDQEVPQNPLDLHPLTAGFGLRYSKRHRETGRGRTAVNSFIAQSVLDSIDENPDVMLDLSKTAFEELIAELDPGDDLFYP